MLKIHRIATTSFLTWGPDITEPESRPTSPTSLTPEQGFKGADSWVDIDEEHTTIPASDCSITKFACSGDSKHILRADSRCNTPTTDPALSGTTLTTDSHTLDMVTFPSHATHLLPSEPNGTWRTQVSYTLKNPSEPASTFREALEQHAHELDVPSFLHKLEQVAEERKDEFSEWLNQTLANYDLVEMHNRVRRLVPVISMPNMRQLDYAVDTVTEIAQSLRKRRSESDLLQCHQDDKYIFAQIIGEKAHRALIEQGICEKWQFLDGGHSKMQQIMQSTLMHTFTRIRQLYENVPLFRAKPCWTANREKKVWRLELDVGVVGVEVGPVADTSLVELGFIDTSFELPESYACVSIADIERQVEDAEDEWQLLEA
ncbi:hypothetical protein BU25DRAFT_457952 [Macroventuria anomochaeta]|uniref:Uncharacterized protein n=1 Tax=Macroventuria anomochaeta TaxID=301207 RepID=A0ACB6S4F7_9PLEO|nr:uncharacterized protein BU25DRAFT_457952 [Macroventuria anomochaeta]KAF2628089.1 hypothetical protein BU25DRAFT_457952 [Macroventuria anomochaeta]